LKPQSLEHRNHTPNKFLNIFTLLCVLCVVAVAGSPLWAGTYYVSKSGSNDNSCAAAQSPGPSAKRTVTAGLLCLSAGDTLYIQEGTYTEDSAKVPSGIPGAHIRISGFQNDNVVLQGNIWPQDGSMLVFEATAFVDIVNLTLDGINGNSFKRNDGCLTGTEVVYIGRGSGFLTFTNVEIKNAHGNSVVVTWDSLGHVTFNGGSIHDGGSSGYDHAIYSMGTTNTYQEMDIYDIQGSGIKFGEAPTSSNVARANRIHAFGLDQTATCSSGTAGIVVSQYSNGALFYNNVIYDSRSGVSTNYASGAYIFDGTDTKLYNNTFAGLGTADYAIYIEAYAANTVVRNNLAADLASVDRGSATQSSNNLCPLAGALCEVTGGADFVAPGEDFHLLSTSSAIDAGWNLSELFGDDFDGVARDPWFDIGAYEFRSGEDNSVGSRRVPRGSRPPKRL
jgi:hypothetical protein